MYKCKVVGSGIVVVGNSVLAMKLCRWVSLDTPRMGFAYEGARFRKFTVLKANNMYMFNANNFEENFIVSNVDYNYACYMWLILLRFPWSTYKSGVASKLTH